MFIAGHVYVYHCTWINPPHDKIALCICAERQWFFWFNTTARSHGHGQLPILANSHPAITRDCHLDLSGVKAASAAELNEAIDRGPIEDALRTQILRMLASPIKTLSEAHRTLALTNLSLAVDDSGD